MKRDIKYIIKRILIGVGITLVLGFIGKSNVFAEEKQELNVDVFGWNCPIQQSNYSSYITDYSFDIGNYNINLKHADTKHDNEPYLSYISAVFTNSNGDYIVYTANTFNPTFINSQFTYFYDLSSLDINSSGYVFYDSNNNATLLTGNEENIVYSQFFTYTLNSDTNSNFQNMFSDYRSKSECTNNTNLYANQYEVETYNGSPSTYSQFFNTLSYLFNNYTFEYSNIPISINGVNQTPSGVPSDYSKVDLTGYQAILLVPENYPYLASEYGYIDSNNDEMIHYTFGYENCVRPILVDITNLDKWYSNSQWNQGFLSSDPAENSPNNSNNNYCSSSAELMSLDYPIQTNNEYNYMGILIYNNSVDYSNDDSNNWINNQHNPYGTSYVYVNEDYYDYYLISDYDSFNQTLDFTDFNQENTTLYISSLPTFDDLVSSSISDTDFDDITGTKQRINKILGFVKLPINFFSRLPDLQCEPLSAPFPHGNFNIELPCLSSSFESFMGSTLFNIVRLIINGLLSYRVISGLVVFTYSRLDPKDMRLDVGAL